MSSIVALIGDNAPTNKALAKRLGPPKSGCGLIGCHSHRFIIAMQEFLSSHSTLIDVVHYIMRKLSSLIPSARLRQLSTLKPKLNFVTSWSSTFEMLNRFEKLRESIVQLGTEEIEELMPKSRELRELDVMCAQLSDLNSVTQSLQDECISMQIVHALFDGVTEEYPQMVVRINQCADIVLYPAFECD